MERKLPSRVVWQTESENLHKNRSPKMPKITMREHINRTLDNIAQKIHASAHEHTHIHTDVYKRFIFIQMYSLYILVFYTDLIFLFYLQRFIHNMLQKIN